MCLNRIRVIGIFALLAGAGGDALAAGEAASGVLGGAIASALPWVAESQLGLVADLSGIEVLLPPAPFSAAAQITFGPQWYAASAQADGVSLSIHGIARVSEHVQLAADVQSGAAVLEPVRVSESHAIWSVAFERGGVAYVLDYECAGGDLDSRCASPDAALAVVEALLVMAVPQ